MTSGDGGASEPTALASSGPAALEIGPARAEELAEVARIHVEASRSAYRDLLPPSWLEAFTIEDRHRQLLTMRADPAYRGAVLVGRRRSAVVAFVQVGPDRGDPAGVAGEVWTMYADPTVWGAGVAGPVLDTGVAHLRVQGHEAIVLWVLEANARARRFYEKRGWGADGTRRTIGPEARIPELRYRLA